MYSFIDEPPYIFYYYSIGFLYIQYITLVKKAASKQTPAHILSGVCLKGAPEMYENNDPNADLEDLLFCEEDGKPSNR